MLEAVAVNSGWKSRDFQVVIVSPEKPTGYLWLPGPANRENISGLLPSLALSRKWKWFSIQRGSTPGTLEYSPCCQSIHQKSHACFSMFRCNISIFASMNFGLVGLN